MDIIWSNASSGRERPPWLLLIKNGEVIPFEGATVPGVVTVREGPRKGGHAVYRLALDHGVRPVPGYDGVNAHASVEELRFALCGAYGPFLSWEDASRAFGLPVPVVQAFLRGSRPKIAEVIERADAAAPFMSLESLRDETLSSDVAAELIERAVARGLAGWIGHPDREDIALRALVVIDCVIDGRKITERLANAALAFTELFTTAKLFPFGPSVSRRAGSIRQSVILRLRALRESIRNEQVDAVNHFDDDRMTPRDP